MSENEWITAQPKSKNRKDRKGATHINSNPSLARANSKPSFSVLRRSSLSSHDQSGSSHTSIHTPSKSRRRRPEPPVDLNTCAFVCDDLLARVPASPWLLQLVNAVVSSASHTYSIASSPVPYPDSYLYPSTAAAPSVYTDLSVSSPFAPSPLVLAVRTLVADASRLADGWSVVAAEVLDAAQRELVWVAHQSERASAYAPSPAAQYSTTHTHPVPTAAAVLGTNYMLERSEGALPLPFSSLMADDAAGTSPGPSLRGCLFPAVGALARLITDLSARPAALPDICCPLLPAFSALISHALPTHTYAQTHTRTRTHAYGSTTDIPSVASDAGESGGGGIRDGSAETGSGYRYGDRGHVYPFAHLLRRRAREWSDEDGLAGDAHTYTHTQPQASSQAHGQADTLVSAGAGAGVGAPSVDGYRSGSVRALHARALARTAATHAHGNSTVTVSMHDAHPRGPQPGMECAAACAVECGARTMVHLALRTRCICTRVHNSSNTLAFPMADVAAAVDNPSSAPAAATATPPATITPPADVAGADAVLLDSSAPLTSPHAPTLAAAPTPAGSALLLAAQALAARDACAAAVRCSLRVLSRHMLHVDMPAATHNAAPINSDGSSLFASASSPCSTSTSSSPSPSPSPSPSYLPLSSWGWAPSALPPLLLGLSHAVIPITTAATTAAAADGAPSSASSASTQWTALARALAQTPLSTHTPACPTPGADAASFLAGTLHTLLTLLSPAALPLGPSLPPPAQSLATLAASARALALLLDALTRPYAHWLLVAAHTHTTSATASTTTSTSTSKPRAVATAPRPPPQDVVEALRALARTLTAAAPALLALLAACAAPVAAPSLVLLGVALCRLLLSALPLLAHPVLAPCSDAAAALATLPTSLLSLARPTQPAPRRRAARVQPASHSSPLPLLTLALALALPHVAPVLSPLLLLPQALPNPAYAPLQHSRALAALPPVLSLLPVTPASLARALDPHAGVPTLLSLALSPSPRISALAATLLPHALLALRRLLPAAHTDLPLPRAPHAPAPTSAVARAAVAAHTVAHALTLVLQMGSARAARQLLHTPTHAHSHGQSPLTDGDDVDHSRATSVRVGMSEVTHAAPTSTPLHTHADSSARPDALSFLPLALRRLQPSPAPTPTRVLALLTHFAPTLAALLRLPLHPLVDHTRLAILPLLARAPMYTTEVPALSSSSSPTPLSPSGSTVPLAPFPSPSPLPLYILAGRGVLAPLLMAVALPLARVAAPADHAMVIGDSSILHAPAVPAATAATISAPTRADTGAGVAVGARGKAPLHGIEVRALLTHALARFLTLLDTRPPSSTATSSSPPSPSPSRLPSEAALLQQLATHIAALPLAAASLTDADPSNALMSSSFPSSSPSTSTTSSATLSLSSTPSSSSSSSSPPPPHPLLAALPSSLLAMLASSPPAPHVLALHAPTLCSLLFPALAPSFLLAALTHVPTASPLDLVLSFYPSSPPTPHPCLLALRAIAALAAPQNTPDAYTAEVSPSMSSTGPSSLPTALATALWLPCLRAVVLFEAVHEALVAHTQAQTSPGTEMGTLSQAEVQLHTGATFAAVATGGAAASSLPAHCSDAAPSLALPALLAAELGTSTLPAALTPASVLPLRVAATAALAALPTPAQLPSEALAMLPLLPFPHVAMQASAHADCCAATDTASSASATAMPAAVADADPIDPTTVSPSYSPASLLLHLAARHLSLHTPAPLLSPALSLLSHAVLTLPALLAPAVHLLLSLPHPHPRRSPPTLRSLAALLPLIRTRHSAQCLHSRHLSLPLLACVLARSLAPAAPEKVAVHATQLLAVAVESGVAVATHTRACEGLCGLHRCGGDVADGAVGDSVSASGESGNGGDSEGACVCCVCASALLSRLRSHSLTIRPLLACLRLAPILLPHTYHALSSAVLEALTALTPALHDTPACEAMQRWPQLCAASAALRERARGLLDNVLQIARYGDSDSHIQGQNGSAS